MTDAEVAGRLRRARAASRVVAALTIGVVLFLLLGEEVETWISRPVLYFGSGLLCGLNTYAAGRTASLRRQPSRSR